MQVTPVLGRERDERVHLSSCFGRSQDLPLQVVKLGGDAIDVSDSIAIGVTERGGVDLVDDGALPPLGLR